MALEQEVKDVIIQTLSVKAEEVKMEQSLYDCLGMDSTEIVDLRVALEKRFAVKINPGELTKDSSPQQIVSLIESKKGAA